MSVRVPFGLGSHIRPLRGSGIRAAGRQDSATPRGDGSTDEDQPPTSACAAPEGATYASDDAQHSPASLARQRALQRAISFRRYMSERRGGEYYGGTTESCGGRADCKLEHAPSQHTRHQEKLSRAPWELMGGRCQQGVEAASEAVRDDGRRRSAAGGRHSQVGACARQGAKMRLDGKERWEAKERRDGGVEAAR